MGDVGRFWCLHSKITGARESHLLTTRRTVMQKQLQRAGNKLSGQDSGPHIQGILHSGGALLRVLNLTGHPGLVSPQPSWAPSGSSDLRNLKGSPVPGKLSDQLCTTVFSADIIWFKMLQRVTSLQRQPFFQYKSLQSGQKQQCD